jgi:predicted Zn-dependent peptidase
MFQKTVLKSGLRIITVPMKNTEAVTILALVGTGSKYEKKEINGISHFLEHLYFKGTKKRPTPIAVAETLDKIGGIFNAFTSEEYTGYFAKVSTLNFELALDWVSDIFLNSILPEKEIEKERGVITEEINMTLDNPMNHIQNLWSQLLYGDQPAGRPITGSKENIKIISREDLAKYRENQYAAENTIISIAGNINPKKSLERVKKYFSKIKNLKPEKKTRVIDASIRSASTLSHNRRVEKQEKPKILLHFKETDQAHLCFGVRGYNIFHPLRYAQELLALILGGMMSSRLFVKIRGKLGMAYYINTDINTNPDTGYLVTQAGVDNTKIEIAVSTILAEYKKISQKIVPDEELKKAKDNIKGRLSLLLESSDAQASFYASQDLLEKKILTPKEIFNQIDKISSDDILKLAKYIFRPEKLNLALIGPFKNKERFQKLINS